MDVTVAARRWAETWTRAWRAKDADAIAALYARESLYRSRPFRDPRTGPEGARAYVEENFDVEEEIECWFGDPIVSGDRAAIQWWGTWVENGEELTLAGTSVLRFDADGLVVDHRDYWNQDEGRRPPYAGW